MRPSRKHWEVVVILAGALCIPGALSAQSPAANGADGTSPATGQQAPEPTPATANPATLTPPAPAASTTTEAPTGDSQGAATGDPGGSVIHHLAADVSIPLSTSWQEFSIGSVPPPAAIAAFAPPFHLSGILALQNAKQVAMLQFATSSNPLIGHDSNWLDAQMHMPSGSGMSVLDMIFYYFFPPSSTCIEQVLTKDPKATFAPVPAGSSETDSSGGPVLQVSLACKPSATLEGFFQSQVSSGITFAQTNSGPRAFADIAKFYLGPMERVSMNGMTWYVFEAQRIDPLGAKAGTNFNLPGNLQGAQSDYFWAIGAIAPFPFANDAPRANQSLIHVAYASVGVNGNKHADFMALLQKVQVKGAGAATP